MAKCAVLQYAKKKLLNVLGICEQKKVLQKQSDFLDPNPQTVNVFDGNNKYTNVNIGATNYAMGPRDINTTDYDVGPGDKGVIYIMVIPTLHIMILMTMMKKTKLMEIIMKEII